MVRGSPYGSYGTLILQTKTETKTREAETKTSRVETKTNTRDRDLCCLGHDEHTNSFHSSTFEYCTAVNVIMHKNIEIGLSNTKPVKSILKCQLS